MRNEIATAPTRGILPRDYPFTIVESRAEIIETIRQLPGTDGTQIALVTIHLIYKNAERTGRAKNQQDKSAGQATTSLLQNIRVLVRKTDPVFLYQHTLYFVLPGANLQGAEIVEKRLWDALLWSINNTHELEGPRPAKLSGGHGAFPDPHASLEDLLRAASKARRRSGGHPERAWQADPGHGEEELLSQKEQEELPLLARRLGIPYLALLPRKLPQHVLHLVNARLAQELRCYPIGRERNMLTVAMLNPQDHKALERLRQETGLRIFPVLTHPEALESALEQLS